MSKKDIEQLKSLIESAEKSIEEAKNIFKNLTGDSLSAPKNEKSASFNVSDDSGQIIEGKFDGQSMVDDTGKLYPVPANYASKSKLVEGDRLKLTVASDGSFVFKQIGPVDRKRVIAFVKRDANARGYVLEAEGKNYKVLFASVTYFKVEDGDSVVALIPKNGEASWAAIENALQGGGPANHNFTNFDNLNENFSLNNNLSKKNESAKDIDEIIGKNISEIKKQEDIKIGNEDNGFEW